MGMENFTKIWSSLLTCGRQIAVDFVHAIKTVCRNVLLFAFKEFKCNKKIFFMLFTCLDEVMQNHLELMTLLDFV